MSPRFPSAVDVLDELVTLGEVMEAEKKPEPRKFRSFRVPHSRQDLQRAPQRIKEKFLIREGA